jgi:hypothetical protein
LLGGVGLLAAALGLVRLAIDEADRPGAMSPVAGVPASAPTPAIPRPPLCRPSSRPEPFLATLSSTQRQTLAPLEQVWPTLSEGAPPMARDRFQLRDEVGATQDRMHARIAQWSKLSSAQR